MRKNHVREKLRAGDAVIGAFLGLGSPNVAELMACAGYDWLVVETEHNPKMGCRLKSAEVGGPRAVWRHTAFRPGCHSTFGNHCTKKPLNLKKFSKNR